MGARYRAVPTHDHCLKIETAVMERIRSDSFEWLFSRSSNMVHELVGEVPIQRVLRSSPVIRQQLHCSKLGVEERCVIAKVQALSHTPAPLLIETYLAEEAVFLAIGLDSNHPMYCFNHTFIFASF